MMSTVRRALISVADKRGIVDFARALAALRVEIVASGGTAKHLEAAGIDVLEVADYVGSPVLLEGRVKTLHPRIHAEILAKRNSEVHRLEIQRAGWGYIDMVVVNLPPVPAAGEKDPVVTLETMDIGGPALLRAAVKNFNDVVVICNPHWYDLILDELKAGEIGRGIRTRLAREALEVIIRYDTYFHDYLQRLTSPPHAQMPSRIKLELHKERDLRYGENSHQKAALYGYGEWREPAVLQAQKLHGKDLSFNNYLDLDAALEITKSFQQGACAIVKHANPCGVGTGETMFEAFNRARLTDPDSAFGGIVSFNRQVDVGAAREISSFFVECVIAPDYEEEALAMLQNKKNTRILKLPQLREWTDSEKMRDKIYELRSIGGGIALQERDRRTVGPGDLKYVTKYKPTPQAVASLFFAWTVVRHVRSNAIVITSSTETIGIGAGQMSRVDACRIAVEKARKPIEEAVAASDGFFPFPDGIEVLARAGVKAVIQPGGSKRDAEVIKACDDLGIAMVFTGVRCFKH
jgi:phosphoribosylaminoimidazolecarboxamide formyltransferase/IMP cyclohydrolase